MASEPICCTEPQRARGNYGYNGEHRVLKDALKKAHVAKSVTLDDFF